MHIHILGICGTFMGGVGQLAKEAGHEVSGSDEHVYPPMSTVLQACGISISQGYLPEHLQQSRPDMVVVGNVMTRGNPAIEYLLNSDIPYTSGPQWLREHILQDRWVLAAAGTHGKTSTASLLAWILEYAKLTPGFLIGGVPKNFGVSARLGESPFFVVEADEYDTAFFDKRSKFVHYRPQTLILNNLEFDHADIFDDLQAIKRQFHHLVRTVPGEGLIIHNKGDTNLVATLAMGCWTPCETFSIDDASANWSARLIDLDGSQFKLFHNTDLVGEVSWSQIGLHNVSNALAAMAAAAHAGISIATAISALDEFEGVKRRLEVRNRIRGITIYDDFAHHPTAIMATVDALRARVGQARIITVVEPRSNTMRMGIHATSLAASLDSADRVIFYQPKDLKWSLPDIAKSLGQKASVFDSVNVIVDHLSKVLTPEDHVLIMSNGGFEGLPSKLEKELKAGRRDV